jgi:hypothetical protein
MLDTQQQIKEICDSIKELLLQKNAKYGDSALNPTRIFSKANPIEQLYVRIDDKLSRISKGAGLLATDEDVINDLIGYLVLLKIAMNNQSNKWDGCDINEFLSVNKYLWNTSDAPASSRNASELNDTEWLELYASGDKFC